MKARLSLLLITASASVHAQMPITTQAHVPPMQVSNEANKEQLALASRQGIAYVALVAWERRGAAWSAAVDAGDYRLIAALSPPEGSWSATSGAPAWQDAPAGMVHLRVFPEDRGSGRFVPGLTIRARFIGRDGASLGEALLPFALYPATDAYGANIALPIGTTSLAVMIEPLRIMRHDPYNGDRFSTATTAMMPLSLAGPIAGVVPASDRAEHAPAELIAARRSALEDTLKAMWKQASSGAEKTADGLIVDYAIEYAESFWMFNDKGQFRYSIENDSSNEENAHIEIAPRDPRTGRFLPAAHITATLTGDKGDAGTNDVPLLWHSWLYHFGRNWRVPHSGLYRMDVRIVPDQVTHYGRTTGNSFFAPVAVTFTDAKIKTGGK